MSTAISHDLTLGRVVLTLPQPVADPQVHQWRRRVTDTLERISLYPAIPPQAILIVRQLDDPLPGELLANRIQTWEQATQRHLEDCWRGAIRPSQGTVPASTNAVWFADQAEWLACLSWDIHQGIAHDRWWWQSWLQRRSHLNIPDALMQLWQPDVQWLPQTLTLLYEKHRSGLRSLLTRLAPDQVSRLRQDVALAYGLAPTLPVEAIAHRLERTLPAPLRAMTASLAEETQALVVLCHTLLHGPQALGSLCQGSALPETETPAPPSGTEPGISPKDQDPTQPEAVTEVLYAEPTEIPPAGTISKNDLPQSTDRLPLTPPQSDVAPPRSDRGDLPPARPRIVSMAVIPPEPAVTSSAGPSAKPAEVDTVQPDATEAVGSLPFVAESGIATGIGGIWYLVNVLVDLDWVPTEEVLNRWHKLQGLAQAFLGGSGDGQPSPPTPLPQGEGSSPNVGADGIGRPPGLPDVVWGVLAGLAEDEVPEAVLDRWVNTALPQVDRYLSDRLELPESPREVMAAILREPATLYVTRTHIDVLFSLEQIRLDVRMAGLDRDPGWVPELARVIAFHYE
jgi:hypothetical protein